MFLLFMLFWVILNGRVTVEILLFGLVISAAVFWFICRFMDYSIAKEKMLIKSSGLMTVYILVLIKEIYKANIGVVKLILSPKFLPEPAMVYFNCPLKTGLGKAMLANSITLTPGTITVSVKGDEYCVHCLDKEMAEGLENGVFVQMIHQLEEVWQ